MCWRFDLWKIVLKMFECLFRKRESVRVFQKRPSLHCLKTHLHSVKFANLGTPLTTSLHGSAHGRVYLRVAANKFSRYQNAHSDCEIIAVGEMQANEYAVLSAEHFIVILVKHIRPPKALEFPNISN